MDIRRIAKLIEKGQRGLDDVADLFLAEQKEEAVQETLDLYRDARRRIYIEAALMGTEDLSRIVEIFGFPISVVRLYELAFFNMREVSRLDRLLHVESCEDEYEKNLKRWSMTQGVEFLAWRLGLKVELVPVDVVTTLQADCYFKAKEAFFNPNSAEASKEAMKWTRLAAQLSGVVKSWVSNNKEAMQDIELALQTLGAGDVNFGDINEVLLENGAEPLTTLEEGEADLGDIEDILKQNRPTEE